MVGARDEAEGPGEARPGLQGQVVAGKYELLRLLGQGGMGAVYEGRNRSTLKRCAVKLLLSPELAANANVVARFFREARASSVIESDHIVQVYDSGSDPGTGYPYMVMELLQGEDLEATIERLGAVHPTAVTKLVLQAAMGLAKAHAAGIVHRDIKPANLFVTRRDSGDLVVKVLDFGIAKIKLEQLQETSPGLTRTGSLLGTPLYMSPEQARGLPNIDARSDVWSLGVAMYQLLSGASPFAEATSFGDLMVGIITSEIPALQDRAPWVPTELAQVVHRAMSRDLSSRYQNAGELRDALAALVPEGARLEADELRSLPLEVQQRAAPRPPAPSAEAEGSTRGALAVSQATAPVKRSRSRLLLAPGVVIALAAGWGLVYRHRTTLPAPVVPAAAEVATAPSASAPAPDSPAAVRYLLPVGPAGVAVTVDGIPAEVVDGGVELNGTPGATRRVRLSSQSHGSETLVAITRSGLVPSRLALEPTAAPNARPQARSPKPAAANAAETPPGTPVAPAQNAPTVVKDLGEFGN